VGAGSKARSASIDIAVAAAAAAAPDRDGRLLLLLLLLLLCCRRDIAIACCCCWGSIVGLWIDRSDCYDWLGLINPSSAPPGTQGGAAHQ
jgi:hypothetical protein